MGSKLWKLLFLDNLSALNCKISLCCFISQYSTCTLQNDNFIRITFVGRLSDAWQYLHANKSNTVTAKEDVRQKVFLLQCNVNTDLLVFIKLKFLRILNFSQSFQEQVMTCSSCNYNIWERKKTGYSCTWIYFNIYFLHNPFHLVHDKLHGEANICTQ